MKFKMSEKSLFAVLLRSPWWISIALVGVFGLAARALLPAPYFIFGAMGAFPFLAIGLIAAWRQWHAPDPAQIEQALASATTLSWAEFSAAVEAGYQRQGFAVERLKSAPADFQLTRAGRTTLVQCKRWKAAALGVDTLRELVAAQHAAGGDQSAVIALAPLTQAARRYAQEHGVHATTGPELAVLLTQLVRP